MRRNAAENPLAALRPELREKEQPKKDPREKDERLLVEAAQRDPRCFGELYELHFHRVYGYAVKRLHSREEAEDVTSVVFHQALAKIKSYEWRGVPFSAWLIRIAANAISDRWKSAAHESADSVPDGINNDLKDANAEDVEQRVVLFQLVEGLPAEQQRVVMLRFVEQKSIREIAKEIRKTEGAVKQLQFRALQKLRAQMEGADA
jgi:RNA polymerase sigma-70 factor, ECF subfamily